MLPRTARLLPHLLFAGASLLLGPTPTQAQGDEPAATRLMLEADRLLQSGEAGAALLEYSALVDRFPQSSQAPRALARAAEIEFDLGDLQSAQSTAERLVDSYGRSGESATGLVLQARILLERANRVEDLGEALTLLKRVPNLYGSGRFPLLEARAEALVLAGELLILLDDVGEAAASFVEAIEDEPRSPFTLRAQVGLGRVLALRGERVPAMEALQAAIDEGLSLGDEGAQATVADARRRLDLLYRYWIRSELGQSPWTEAETLQPTGIEWKKPIGAAAVKGEVLVADNGIGVVHFDAQGSVSQSAVRNPGRPFVGPTGSLYYLAESAVRGLDPPASFTFHIGEEKPEQLDKLQAGARGVLDEWYLVDKSSDGVFVFSEDRNQHSLLSSEIEAVDIAVDERGSLYVLSDRPPRITVHDLDRRSISVISGTWRRPLALDVDWLGNVYVLDGASDTVSVVDASGTAVTTIPSTLPGGINLRSPEDVAVDTSGSVVVTDPRLSAVIRLN